MAHIIRLLAAVTLIVTSAEAGTKIHFTRASIDPNQTQFRVLDQKSANEVIIQYQNTVTEADKSQLRSLGYEILGYLPDDAVVVRGTMNQVEKDIKAITGVNAVVPYSPEFKISSSVTSLTTGPVGDETWVVTGFNKVNFLTVANQIRQQFKVLAVDSRSLVLRAPRNQLLKIASVPGVEHVQEYPDFQTFYMDIMAESESMESQAAALDGSESGTKLMNFDSAWNQKWTGKGQIVSFADTGLDNGNSASIHPDFAGSIKAGQALGIGGKSWEDPMGHGTHVAGSIAGRGTASQGLLKGGAYESMIVAQSMWSPIMNNIVPPSKLETLFRNAAQEGATAHSNSWGSPKNLGAYDGFAQQVDDFAFKNPDVLLIFAAGNSGEDNNKDGRIDGGSISSPATSKNSLAVGASENVVSTGGIQVPISRLRDPSKWSQEPIFSSKISDHPNGIAMFSSRGPTSDGRIKPDVVAPGTNILSTRSRHKDSSDLWGRYDDHYVWSGGTSMATPLAAGAVMVARQYVVEKMGLKNPSAALMKSVIMHNAVEMYPGQYGEGGAQKGQEILKLRPNSDEGYGRVDAAVLTSMTNSTKLADERVGVGAGEEKSYDLQISAGKLLANLVYNDAPASPNAAQALVNDLDLVLIKPDGTQVASWDRINNHEVIELSGLPAGSYKLVVKGHKVPQGINGKQPFALIWTAK